MILADKLIIDLSNLNLISNKISKYLYRLTKLTKNAQSIDTGNDIEYSAKQLLIFKSKLLQLVSKESKKYQSDIFGNIIKSLNKYRYVEMMFSENYREITSIRLVGKNRDKTYNRYVLFNIENIFDPTVINLLVNAEEIIASIKRGSVAKTKYIQFLKNYFAPFPLLHQLKQQDSNFLENISLKYDNGQPKTYEELMKQNIELNSLSFKTAIFDKRKNSTSSVDGLSFLKPEIDSILKKLETAEQDNDPQELINLSQTYFLDKFKLPDVTESIYEGLSLDLNPYNSLLKLSAIDIFKSIDSFPPDIKKKIYEVLRDPRNPFNINKIFIDLQEFINLKLNIDGVVNTGISVLLKESSLDIESMDLKDLAIKIINHILSLKNAVFMGFKTSNIKDEFKKFYLDTWSASDPNNRIDNDNSRLQPALLRPYGKWYKYFFGKTTVKNYCYMGIFSINKLDIIKHDISRYTQLLNSVSTHSNPEVGHYIERSWAAIFHPLVATKFVQI